MIREYTQAALEVISGLTHGHYYMLASILYHIVIVGLPSRNVHFLVSIIMHRSGFAEQLLRKPSCHARNVLMRSRARASEPWSAREGVRSMSIASNALAFADNRDEQWRCGFPA